MALPRHDGALDGRAATAHTASSIGAAEIGALVRRSAIELGWFAFALANLGAMARWPSWETIPFHFIWISLTLVYGFRVWEPAPTGIVLALVIAGTGSLILGDAFSGEQLWG